MNRVAAGLLAAAATAGAAAALRAWPLGGARRWRRTNFRGTPVDLTGGLATAGGAVLGTAASGGRAGVGAALAAGTSGLLGAIDDADTDSGSKGLRGHLQALSRGEVTTGLIKLVGISGVSLVTAIVVTGARGRRSRVSGPVARTGDVLTSAALVAGTANLVNLFDLRPGRALKVAGAVNAVLCLVPGPSGRVAAAALGAVAASWEDDLAERTMLGDAGANALGAVTGTALALLGPARVRQVAAALVVGLVLASEKVSFSEVIASTPALRRLDDWGRAG